MSPVQYLICNLNPGLERWTPPLTMKTDITNYYETYDELWLTTYIRSFKCNDLKAVSNPGYSNYVEIFWNKKKNQGFIDSCCLLASKPQPAFSLWLLPLYVITLCSFPEHTHTHTHSHTRARPRSPIIHAAPCIPPSSWCYFLSPWGAEGWV